MREIPDLERRLYAFALDRLLLWGWYAVVAAACWAAWGVDRLGLIVGIVLGVGVGATLAGGVVVGLTGATLGQRLIGLRVVHHQTGTPIGVGAGLLRSAIVAVAAAPTMGFGLAALAWTALVDPSGLRRGWHDQRVGSVVVDVRPVAEHVEVPEELPRQVVNLTALRLVPDPLQPVPRLAPVSPAPPATRAATPATPRPVVAQPVPPAQVPAHVPVLPVAPVHPDEESGRTVVRPQLGAGVEPVGRAAAPAPTRWLVTFDTGESFLIEGTVLVGRHPEPRPGERVRHVVALPSADMSLSKTHAQFGPAPDGTLVVMDRGSTNGSLLVRSGVTRELVPGRPTTLVAGDRVRFGDREMTIHRQD